MSPERRYRLLLLSYPRSYRAERAEEMLDVLLAAEGRRGAWSRTSEAVSLVGHGLALRLSPAVVRPAFSPSVGLAGVSLLCLLAVLGAQQLPAAGIRGLGLDGYPDEWRIDVLWVDPRWPVHALWVPPGWPCCSGGTASAVASAWAAAALQAWHLLVTAVTSVELPWPGDVGPHWVALRGQPRRRSWLVLSVAGAVMLGGPARAARCRRRPCPRRGLGARRGRPGRGRPGRGRRPGGVLRRPGAGGLALADTVRGPAAPLVPPPPCSPHGCSRCRRPGRPGPARRCWPRRRSPRAGRSR